VNIERRYKDLAACVADPAANDSVVLICVSCPGYVYAIEGDAPGWGMQHRKAHVQVGEAGPEFEVLRVDK